MFILASAYIAGAALLMRFIMPRDTVKAHPLSCLLAAAIWPVLVPIGVGVGVHTAWKQNRNRRDA